MHRQLRSSILIVSIDLFLFFVGDRLLLTTKNLQLTGICKLNARLIGYFVVTACVGPGAYKLDLTAAYSALFLIFYISKLHTYQDNGGDGGTGVFCPVLRDGQEEFEVDSIVG